MYQMNPPQPAVPPEPYKDRKRLSVPQIMLIVLTLAFAAWYLITSLFCPDYRRYARRPVYGGLPDCKERSAL